MSFFFKLLFLYLKECKKLENENTNIKQKLKSAYEEIDFLKNEMLSIRTDAVNKLLNNSEKLHLPSQPSTIVNMWSP